MSMRRNTAGRLALYIAVAAWAAPSFGAAPAAAAATSPLNDTGQTACFDDDGLAVDCAGTGRDGETGRDVTQNRPGNGKAGFAFIKIGPGGEALPQKATEWACVEDKVTGLVWEGKTDDGGLHDGDNRYLNRGNGKPNDASGLVAAVNQEGLCGHADWRLPTRAELHSLMFYQAGSGKVMIDAAWFPHTATTAETWSSDIVVIAASGKYAGTVRFGDGLLLYLSRDQPLAVRLVRSSDGTKPPAAERWIFAGDEVTDTTTGLTWRRCAEGQSWTGSTCDGLPPFELAKRGFAQAKKEALRTGKPWRVPNVKELASILDLSQMPHSAVDPAVFPISTGGKYLTSTHDMNRPNLFWGITLGSGAIGSARKSSLKLVRDAD